MLFSVSSTVCPKPLMSQARLAIRGYLAFANKEPAIDSLDIPLILRNYLKHETSDVMWCFSSSFLNFFFFYTFFKFLPEQAKGLFYIRFVYSCEVRRFSFMSTKLLEAKGGLHVGKSTVSLGSVTTSVATRDHSNTMHCGYPKLRLLTGTIVILILPHNIHFGSLLYSGDITQTHVVTLLI